MEQRWHVGTWMVPSYDPELNLIYVGTSVTIPGAEIHPRRQRQEAPLSQLHARLNADTGKIVWYYQHVVDHWDLDHPFERLLVDTAVAPNPRDVTWINPKVKAGERRKVVTGIPGKTGIVYTLDRQTGEFLWARPTVAQNVISTIDGNTGEVIVNREALFTKINEEKVDLPGQQRRQELAGRRVQPADQHDVHADAEHVHDGDDDRRHARPVEGVRHHHAPTVRARHRQGRHGVGHLGGNRPDDVEVRTAGGDDVARGDRRRAGVRRRLQRPVQGPRRQDRQGVVGDESRVVGQRLPGVVRGRRKAVCRRDHGSVARGKFHRSA